MYYSNRGHHKTWTLDSRLDRGLDSGLNNGLDKWTKISIAKGKRHLHINQQQSFCLSAAEFANQVNTP